MSREILTWLEAFGLRPYEFMEAARKTAPTIGDYLEFRGELSSFSPLLWPLRFSYPCLHDRNRPSGEASRHYFHQDLLVARRIYERKPKRHVDVGSRVDGFVAHLAIFRTVEVFDIRIQSRTVKNILFRQCDITAPLPPKYYGYCDSLSCLHSLEHFGLGRYGDKIDVQGYERGVEALRQILRKGGILYLSLPIGPQRIEFNAHRVFSIRTILEMTKEFELLGFSYVDDSGMLHENVEIRDASILGNFGCRYGCGIFELRKRDIVNDAAVIKGRRR